MTDTLHHLLPVGTRIRLRNMPQDPDPVAPGTEGTVTGGSDLRSMDMGWQIWVEWDDGRKLSLQVPPDSYEVIT